MTDKQFVRMVHVALVLLLGVPMAVALVVFVLLFTAPPNAETAPQEDTAELMLVPAALWLKVEQALVFWHEEALRYKAMKGCS